MLFNTWGFFVFLVVVLIAYYSLRLQAQNLLILVASYVFYSFWDWRFLSLLILSTLVDYNVGRLLGQTDAERRRKHLVLISIVVNLGILGIFKYFGFFVDSAAALLGAVGLEANLPTLRVILPVGISFYTFQTMAYSIDVYRRNFEPVRDPLVFAAYVAFFPQLVAGPIERPSNLIPQFTNPRWVDSKKFASGGILILIGLVRKVAIADAISPHVDRIFTNPGGQSGLVLLLGVALFGLQIYSDFAGYTDIARGVGRLLGFELMVNFRHPYFARNISDFWRRWHISLSTWLRDYLYIPLGGNRGSRLQTYRNLMLTMLLGGLWHGAAWTFVVWGGIHGVALAVHRWFSRDRRKPAIGRHRQSAGLSPTSLTAIAGWATTMAVVFLGWAFFRADSLGAALEIIQGMFRIDGWGAGSLETLGVFVAGLLIMLVIDIPQFVSDRQEVLLATPWLVRGLSYVSLVMLIVLRNPSVETPFIYFQF